MSAIPRLVMDIGNSRIKWELSFPYFQQGSFVWKDNELDDLFQTCWDALQKPESIYIASVVPRVSQQVMDWVMRKWCVQPIFQGTETAFNGLNNGYEYPEKLGIDRWLAMCHVWTTYRNSAMLVDVGSALTVDYIDQFGNHEGGFICPGPETMLYALSKDTALLSKLILDDNDVKTLQPANNTQSAMSRGIINALVALINQLSSDVSVHCYVMSGGGAELLLPYLKEDWDFIPDVVLRGLSCVADEKG